MSLVKVSHEEIQTKNGKDESSLIVTVYYDVEARSVDSIDSIVAYNYGTGLSTPLTHIFNEQFDHALDSIVDQIDWDAAYLYQLRSNTSMFAA